MLLHSEGHGEKAAGLAALHALGLPTPRTLVIDRHLPLGFPIPEEIAIFRTSTRMTGPISASRAESISGLYESPVVSRSTWIDERPKLAQLLRAHVLLCQPLLSYEIGAIGHLSGAGALRLAISTGIPSIAIGETPLLEGILDLNTGSFVTEARTVTSAVFGFLNEILDNAKALLKLSAEFTIELELCLTRTGELQFLQAQPSSAQVRRRLASHDG